MSKPPLSSTKPPFGSPPAPRWFLSWGSREACRSETGDEKNVTTPIETRRDAISARIRTSAEDGALLWLRVRSESTLAMAPTGHRRGYQQGSNGGPIGGD